MNFCSDNVTGVSPEIMATIIAANEGSVMPYGEDELTHHVQRKIAELFDTEAAVFLVGSGTVANALGISAITTPLEALFCHQGAHIQNFENDASRFFSGGAELRLLPGDHNKISALDLKAALERPRDALREKLLTAVSITQATERGTVYSVDEVSAIAEVAHAHELKVHMDGARFANAVASLGCTPAELTWRAGVDVLSFGATKNGAMAAEAVVLFDHTLSGTFAFRHKQAGQRVSKMRFVAAQFDAYMTDDLWLKNARHANATASRLVDGLKAVPETRIHHPVQINQVFAEFAAPVFDGLLDDGFVFPRRGGPDSTFTRLVTAFNTQVADVDAFIESAHRHATMVSCQGNRSATKDVG